MFTMKEREDENYVTQTDSDEVTQAAHELRRRQSQDIGLEIIRRFFADQATN